MANRLTRNGDDTGPGDVATRGRDREASGSAAARSTAATHATRDTLDYARKRQRAEFGGFNWGSDFFGWLVAVGLAALLTGLLSATGAAIGLSEASGADAAGNASTIGIVGGVLLLIVLLAAYFCGGYVAGRMSRFDGARNGLGVWLIGLAVTVVLAVAAAILGAEYNVLEKINLPAIPVDGKTLTTGGLIASVAIVLGTILAAVTGGKAGERYHRRVDRAGFDAE